MGAGGGGGGRGVDGRGGGGEESPKISFVAVKTAQM